MTKVSGAVLSALALGLAGGAPPSEAASRTLLRINQVGYGQNSAKIAYALTASAAGRVRFLVLRRNGSVALRARSRASCAPWNSRWRGCHVLDFSHLRAPGTYRLRVASATSPPFQVGTGAALYGPLAARAVGFLQAQRDGPEVIPGPLSRRPAHLNDRAARVYLTPRYRHGRLAGALRATGASVDMAGGWFDAGDYLKFSGTASYTDLLLLFTLREYGAHLMDAPALEQEARYGTDWLLKTWDERNRVLYEQVGIGDGNGGSILGDHDIWRLPERDDGYRARSLRFIAHRPVFAANRPGEPISPNLAGREAAAFALCAQVFRASDFAYAHRCLFAGQTLYAAAARRWRGALAGSVPASYYAEPEWRDDMELAAIELYLATLYIRTPDLPHREPYDYLEPASSWANAYMSSRLAGQDSLNLYDVAPLAHYDLYRVMVATGNTTDLYTNASDVIGDLRDQLRLGTRLARTGPLGLADPATPEDTVAHALGYAVEANLYAAIGGDGRYRRFAQQQLNWVLGANPWGASFIVGAGSVFPHCLAHQVANLSGSLRGTAPILAGAVVDGPTGRRDVGPIGAPDGYRRCSARAQELAALDGHGFRYLDDVRSPSTSEPADDFVAVSLLAFAQEAAGLPRAAPLAIPR